MARDSPVVAWAHRGTAHRVCACADAATGCLNRNKTRERFRNPGSGGHPGGPLSRCRNPSPAWERSEGCCVSARLAAHPSQRARALPRHAPPAPPRPPRSPIVELTRRVGCVRAWAMCGLGRGKGTFTKPYIRDHNPTWDMFRSEQRWNQSRTRYHPLPSRLDGCVCHAPAH